MSDNPAKPTGLINQLPTSLLSGDPDETSIAGDEDGDVPPESLDPPAVFANGYFIAVSDGLARISFAETSPSAPPRWRSAVLMTEADALALAKLIIELVGD